MKYITSVDEKFNSSKSNRKLLKSFQFWKGFLLEKEKKLVEIANKNAKYYVLIDLDSLKPIDKFGYNRMNHVQYMNENVDGFKQFVRL